MKIFSHHLRKEGELKKGNQIHPCLALQRKENSAFVLNLSRVNRVTENTGL